MDQTDSVEGYFGQKVNLPKRMRADLLDGTVASAVMHLDMSTNTPSQSSLGGIFLSLEGRF